MPPEQPAGDQRLPPALSERVLHALGLSDAEAECAITALCRANPEHAAPIRAAFAAAARIDTDVGGAPTSDELTPHIDGFTVRANLGRGGMGTVYLAEQDSVGRRPVALKLVRPGLAAARVLERFDVERDALARFDHPNVARVLAAGTTRRGQPFFAMEVVDGAPITTWCDTHRLDLRARLTLLRDVCAGVQHAHERGVLHRDLKPSNILVAHEDGRPRARIIDFGLARALADDRPGKARARLTDFGTVVGTLPYMSPEQLEGSGDVDVRSDVWALGVVCFELLTGRLPFAETEGMDPWAAYDVVSTRHPPLPSRIATAAADAGAGASIEPERLRGDVDAIVLKALERAPARRYQSAAELAEDLDAFLAGRPVQARVQTPAYRLAKLVRRRPWRTTAVVATVASLALGWFATAVARTRIDRLRGLQRDATVRAVHDEAAAEEHARRFDLLAWRVRLRRALTLERDLYPAEPALIERLHAWLREHGAPLDQARTAIANALAELPPPREDADRMLERELRALRTDIDAFVHRELEGVRRRLESARTIAARSITAHADAWRVAIDAIADVGGPCSRYAGLRITPQLGLVPLGMDPDSKLHEFAHLESGRPPERDRGSGRLHIDVDSGVVFVLVPGGRFRMGAQADDPTAPGYDRHATAREAPPTEVELSAFFLAKCELTQAQWQRLSRGENPSRYPAGRSVGGGKDAVTVTALHPVENVSWDMANDLLGRHGLVLPTEAQWEYACRAGTTAPWWFGGDGSSLVVHGNFRDARGQVLLGNLEPTLGTELDDGHFIHAPVGSYAANPFGLFDMHGNVAEWCLDATSEGATTAPRPGDGLRTQAQARSRVQRGGSALSPLTATRCTVRHVQLPDARSINCGLRPARRLVP